MTASKAAPWFILSVILAAGCSSTGKPNMASGESGSSGGDMVASADVQGEKDPRKCELVLPTGSRIAHRVCMKQSEWDAMRENSQRAVYEQQQRAVQQGNPSGN